jgi:hypothetical protein
LSLRFATALNVHLPTNRNSASPRRTQVKEKEEVYHCEINLGTGGEGLDGTPCKANLGCGPFAQLFWLIQGNCKTRREEKRKQCFWSPKERAILYSV